MALTMTNATGDSLGWYVVHTHPKQEERTSSNLNVGGIETLTPKLQVSKPNQYTGKLQHFVKPLFPGYIFARFRYNEQYHKIRYTRGVHSLVCFTSSPTPVDDEIVDLVRSKIAPDGFVKPFEELKPGDAVVIREGRFQHLSGVFEREMEDADRVRILLNTVTFQAHVVVDRAIVNRVIPEKRPTARANFTHSVRSH
jgi:transcriptional antiterminator RfaH